MHSISDITRFYVLAWLECAPCFCSAATRFSTRDGKRILLTHFCAMTPDGHVARLETGALSGAQERRTFVFTGATNLHSTAAPHMRLVVMTVTDHGHFSEKWTMTEHGKDTVFDLNFVRR